MGKYDRQLQEKGIRIIKERQPHATSKTTYLEYNGKRIVKPWESKIPQAVKHYFGVDLGVPVHKKTVKRKATGEAALFKTIWETRPHVSFVSGTPLPYMDVRCFFHVLGKGAYKRFQLFDKNVILTTAEEHHDWHSMTKAELLQKDPRWQKVFDLKEELLKLYNH